MLVQAASMLMFPLMHTMGLFLLLVCVATIGQRGLVSPCRGATVR